MRFPPASWPPPWPGGSTASNGSRSSGAAPCVAFPTSTTWPAPSNFFSATVRRPSREPSSRWMPAIPPRTSAAKPWLPALARTAPVASNPRRILPSVIEELAESCGEAPALLSDRERLTYRALAERSNRYARWALEQGLAKGETVCLLMPNRPEYMAIWLGVTRVGAVVSLLNTNLVGPSLAHCIKIVAPRHIIVAAELADRLATALPGAAGGTQVWAPGAGPGSFPRLDVDIGRYAAQKLSAAELRPLSIQDRALLMYTSGTTGLPKAANISHFRLMELR